MPPCQQTPDRWQNDASAQQQAGRNEEAEPDVAMRELAHPDDVPQGEAKKWGADSPWPHPRPGATPAHTECYAAKGRINASFPGKLQAVQGKRREEMCCLSRRRAQQVIE